ncbi:MAG TPA: tetratricopeptide repeat protein [Kofleriaceae bacterium]|nr:tetratricopeptide repeat protein [Kofleriaceae bacterium]
MRRLLLVIAVLCAPLPAAAQPAADVLGEANAALGAGDYARARALAGRVARAPGPPDRDRAEAWRVLGLAYYYLGDSNGARAAFLEYLKLDPDGSLDSALVPPDAISLFNQVRNDHAAEIDARRPKRHRRSFWLNFVPPAGQWQNGDRGKMWFIAAAGTALLAANITSYVMLSRWCGNPDDTCDEGEPGQPGYSNHTGEARTARVINIGSGVALIALYIYGVYDASSTYHRLEREEAAITPPAPPPVSVAAGADGTSMWVTVGRSF